MPRTYSIYEAKAKLSELLREVKRGREGVITERGRPIAKVVPFREIGTFEERIATMRSQGVILPARATGPLPQGSLRRPGALKRFLADRE